MSIQAEQIDSGNLHILYDVASIAEPGNEFFDIDHWRSINAVSSIVQGRGATCIFRYQEQDYVLRHYHRGGLIASLSDDRYQWSGLAQTRAWREWHLLAEMYQQGLPVPRPIAARVQRHGLFYSADLVTVCLAEVEPMADMLMKKPLPDAVWQEIGGVIRKFHDLGIYHADLNARNILLDANRRVFLIDFDKGEKRKLDAAWQQANLQRLQRSLNKFLKNEKSFNFDDKKMQLLLAGYND